MIYRLPVATLSAVLLGPGTSVAHASMGACANSKTPVCWIAEDGVRFYAFRIAPNRDNGTPRRHALPGQTSRMFSRRFRGINVHAYLVNELRGMEGIRVRAKYAELGQQYGVTWKGRNYDKSNWDLANNINRALSAANASLCRRMVRFRPRKRIPERAKLKLAVFLSNTLATPQRLPPG